MGLLQLSFSSGVPGYPASIRWVAQWYPSVHWVNQLHSSGIPLYTGPASVHWLRVRVWIKLFVTRTQIPSCPWIPLGCYKHLAGEYFDISNLCFPIAPKTSTIPLDNVVMCHDLGVWILNNSWLTLLKALVHRLFDSLCGFRKGMLLTLMVSLMASTMYIHGCQIFAFDPTSRVI